MTNDNGYKAFQQGQGIAMKYDGQVCAAASAGPLYSVPSDDRAPISELQVCHDRADVIKITVIAPSMSGVADNRKHDIAKHAAIIEDAIRLSPLADRVSIDQEKPPKDCYPETNIAFWLGERRMRGNTGHLYN